jgi:hypothetical protein
LAGPGFCCGMTKKRVPCKNSMKFEDTKVGHQKLNTLVREPFDLSTLQSKLCDVARDFLCARWHRQRQADQVGQQCIKPPSATRRECHMTLEFPHHLLCIQTSVRCRQPPGDAWRDQATQIAHLLTGSGKIRRRLCQPAPGQFNQSIHLSLPQCCGPTVFHGTFHRLDQLS